MFGVDESPSIERLVPRLSVLQWRENGWRRVSMFAWIHGFLVSRTQGRLDQATGAFGAPAKGPAESPPDMEEIQDDPDSGKSVSSLLFFFVSLIFL